MVGLFGCAEAMVIYPAGWWYGEMTAVSESSPIVVKAYPVGRGSAAPIMEWRHVLT